MKIILPKHLRGFAYDRVLPVALNNFDVDIVLPGLFFKVVSHGKDKGTVHNDSSDIDGFVARLTRHEDVVGFDTPEAERLLNRLARTTLMQVGGKGEGGRGKQDNIQGLPGRTLLEFKPGFPKYSSHLRKVDALLYRMLLNRLKSDDALSEFVERSFGRGVVVHGGRIPDGSYNGDGSLDVLTRLSIAFLDGFEPVSTRPPPKDKVPYEPCPALADAMARDLWRFVAAYGTPMPGDALTYHFKALINIELFSYTLRLVYAVAALVEHPEELPPAMTAKPERAEPDVYVDFTAWGGEAGALSKAMAADCVRRDIEAIGRFIQANLRLRLLDRYLSQLRRSRHVGDAINVALDGASNDPEYLQALLLLCADPKVMREVEASARSDEDAIRKETVGEDDDAEAASAVNEAIERCTAAAGDDLSAVVALLAEAQQSQITSNVVAWYWSVGGLQKPHGILAGHLKSRLSWRYAPSSDLLATLVQLAAVDIPNAKSGVPQPQSIRLRGFLDWLEDRFGIIVDRPPARFEGAEYVAAAQGNLRAMLRRLQQMGIFRDLSDDFTVQRLMPPYVDALTKASEPA